MENVTQLKALKLHKMKTNRFRTPQPASAAVGSHKNVLVEWVYKALFEGIVP